MDICFVAWQMPSRVSIPVVFTNEVSRLAKNPYKRRFPGPWQPVPGVRVSFWVWSMSVPALITVFTLILGAQVTKAQSGSWNPYQNAAFDEADLAELRRGEPLVTRLKPNHKQEVAVYGLVRVQAPAEVFLQSFRDTIATKSNPAILEIGRFGKVPALDDLKTLTMERRDIEDLKKCVVGKCELKLSARMIEQFQKAVDWQSSEHASQATQLYQQMLLDYVRDYLERGEGALIEYTDKSKTISLLEGQRALLASVPAFANNSSQNGWLPIEDTIVWSKIKFGLKPVLAINHIVILKSEREVGPQVLVLSKQIYANHYFDASVALTGFAKNPEGEHYLFYENHSLADGLHGLFGGIKRRLIEREAVDGLKGVLLHTRMKLDAHAVNQSERGQPSKAGASWRLPRKQSLLLLICITALVMLALASYRWKASVPPGTQAS
jgi:hypothetical protein